jgi:ribonuclease HIII
LSEIEPLVVAVKAGLATAGIRLIAIASKAVFPDEFNRLVERDGNKAEVLSRLTLELVARMFERVGPGPKRVLCDKHGGRNRYGRLLQQQFCETLVEVREEGSIQSAYAWGPKRSRVEVRFRIGCENFLPVALASMASKYLREAAMLAFNRFWCQRLPELRPTAGYPGDARRFWDEIRPLQAELGIDDGLLWRAR